MTSEAILEKFKNLTPVSFKQAQDLLLVLLEGRTEIFELVGCSNAIETLEALRPVKGAKSYNHFQETCDSICDANFDKFMELYGKTVCNAKKHTFHTCMTATKNYRLPEMIDFDNSAGEKLHVNGVNVECRIIITPSGSDADGNTYNKKDATKKASDEIKAKKEAEEKSKMAENAEADKEIVAAEAVEEEFSV